jgi:hypothetical protein|tara:strand:- start:83 stop:232 length:150 start_codon:yes stop_codon:yes gene_type:complete
MSTPQLQAITTDDLLQMLGEREVIAYQQRVLIAQQAARIKELESDDTEP